MATYSDHSINKILGFNQDSPADFQLGTRTRRFKYSTADLDRLEAVFKENQYPDIRIREQLSDELGIPESKIQVWFQNRRTRSGRTKARRGPLRSKNHETNDLKTPNFFSYTGLTPYSYILPCIPTFLPTSPEYYPMALMSSNTLHRPVTSKRREKLAELLQEELRAYETTRSADEDSM